MPVKHVSHQPPTSRSAPSSTTVPGAPRHVAIPPAVDSSPKDSPPPAPLQVTRNVFGEYAAAAPPLPAVRPTSLKGSVLEGRLGKATVQPALGSPAFEQRLDEVSGSHRRPDNSLTVLFDGVASFKARHQLIAQAQESIHLQTFIFAEDDTAWELARALAAKAQEGVQVRLIYDAIGSTHTDDAIFDFMKAQGVQVRPHSEWTDLPNLNARWHQKSMVVDGQAAIVGGMNIADEYALGGSSAPLVGANRKSAKPWRDVDVLVRGPAVTDAQHMFLNNWDELGPAVSQSDRAALCPDTASFDGGPWVRMVQHDPFPAVGPGDHHIRDLYLQCIHSATDSITLESAYFVPATEMREALKAAAARGVRVRIMTNSTETNDVGMVSECARYFYRELLEAGCHIFERTDETLHSKTAAFDGCYAIIGSHNLNGRSEGRDTENVIGTHDENVATSLEARFEQGLKDAQRVTLDDILEQGVFRSLRQFALSTLAWTF